jgi:hypothetical protein
MHDPPTAREDDASLKNGSREWRSPVSGGDYGQTSELISNGENSQYGVTGADAPTVG